MDTIGFATIFLMVLTVESILWTKKLIKLKAQKDRLKYKLNLCTLNRNS